MVDKQYALLPTLDKIFTENEKLLLKTLTSSDQHDYTSVVLPVSCVGSDEGTYARYFEANRKKEFRAKILPINRPNHL